MHGIKKVLALLLAVFCFGCSVTQEISNTIPPEMKQNIKAIKDVNGAGYSFAKFDEGNSLSMPGIFRSNDFSISEPLDNLFRELVETKFGKIIEDSNNKITIQIVSAEVINKSTLEICLDAYVFKGGKENKKTFTYATGISRTLIGKHKSKIDEKNIHNFLLKFVSSVDNLIDSIYQAK
jgi:hypothetical protein